VIVGGPSGGGGGGAAAFTVRVKAGSEAEDVPLLTLIVMLAKLPTLAEDGVPDSSPVSVLKFIHDGTFCAENVRL
jgi:hypothetical protein